MKKYFFLFLFQALLLNNLSAKNHFFSLKNIKNKVEKAVTSTYSQTKQSIKDFINPKSPEEKEIAKLVEKIDNFAKDKNSWANQTDFINQLKKYLLKSKEDAYKIFENKILQTYKKEKDPLIFYASALKKEETELKELSKEIEKNLSKRQYDKLKDKVQLILNLQKNLESLCEISNKLLTK